MTDHTGGNPGTPPHPAHDPRTRRLVARILVAPIRAYQRVLSPLLGPRCRFHPSCSEYAAQAVLRHGPIRGIYLGVRRLLRCHPWNPGGFDDVPETFTWRRTSKIQEAA